MRYSFLFLSCLCSLGAVAQAADKKLIEFGQDSPTPQFAKANWETLDKQPFDGVSFLLGRGAPEPTGDNLSWGGWGNVRFEWNDVKHHAEDLAAAKFENLTNNFVTFVMSPGTVDWFDNFDAIIHNSGLAARIAKQAGHCDGILLDAEMYFNQSLWEYNDIYGKSKYADVHSYDEYVAQARLRGSQVMQAMQQEFPGLNVLATHSYSLAWASWSHNPNNAQNPNSAYTLLPAFLDGLYAAAADGTKIIDGQEIAYHYSSKAEFEACYRTIKQDLLPIVGNIDDYNRSISAGAGLFMTKPKPGVPISPDTNTWYWTPAQFESNLKNALNNTDEYVWVYSEYPFGWFDHRPDFLSMPQEYRNALVRARNAVLPPPSAALWAENFQAYSQGNDLEAAKKLDSKVP